MSSSIEDTINETYFKESTSTDSISETNRGTVWNYEDESHWPGELCRAGGNRQSPIDITVSKVIKDYNQDFIKNGPLQFTGYDKVLVTGFNNGHTIQFRTEGNVDMHPTLTGGPLVHDYRLEQLHFHWLSEHSIDGIKFPMEIHFVHVRKDLDVPKALKKRNGLAIVSVFCNVLADLDEFKLEATEEIMQVMPKLVYTGAKVSGIILDLTKLLDPNTGYYTYAGSLTSPQCNEAVIWILFSSPIYMTDSQYRKFSKIGVGRHNFRSLQEVKMHQVFQPPQSGVKTPQMVIFLERMVKAVADFFKNVTSFVSRGFKHRRR